MSKRRLPKPVVRPPDVAALLLLAGRPTSTERLHEQGYLSMPATRALHRYGYQCRPWLKLSTGHVVLVYHPRFSCSGLPIVTVETYRDQCALHKALGLHCVPPGTQWKEAADAPLFDGILPEESLT